MISRKNIGLKAKNLVVYSEKHQKNITNNYNLWQISRNGRQTAIAFLLCWLLIYLFFL